MKSLFFDAGPVISITMNNLLEVFEPLKKKFRGDFCLTPAIKYELIEKPMKIKRFQFEALQVDKLVRENTFKIWEDHRLDHKTNRLLDIANESIKAKGKWMKLLHRGEIETIAAASLTGSKFVVIDERILRSFFENPKDLANLMSYRLHTKVEYNKEAIRNFREMVGDIKIIRSVELIAVAYKLGLLDKFIPNVKNGRKILLDAILWGLKLDGSAITSKEIKEIKSILS